MLEDAKAWQTRPLEAIYPIVYLDALVIKIRDGQAVRNFACYLAIGVNLEGERDVLGMWFQRNKDKKKVASDLREIYTAVDSPRNGTEVPHGGHEPQRRADRVHDAGLHPCLGVDGLDRLREAGEPVDAADEHVLNAAGLQLGQDLQPELGALHAVSGMRSPKWMRNAVRAVLQLWVCLHFCWARVIAR